MRRIFSFVFYTLAGVVIALGITVLVLRAGRNFGGGVGATVAGAAANITGLNV